MGLLTMSQMNIIVIRHAMVSIPQQVCGKTAERLFQCIGEVMICKCCPSCFPTQPKVIDIKRPNSNLYAKHHCQTRSVSCPYFEKGRGMPKFGNLMFDKFRI